MIITTAGRTSRDMTIRAKEMAKKYNIPYVSRDGISITKLKDLHKKDIVVVGRDGLSISPLSADISLFFHPNLAMVRAKRLLQGEEDPFISVAGLRPGKSLLDCTLGLASDSIVASLVVESNGSVVGVEGNPSLYLLAKEGLSTFHSGRDAFDRAMRNVHVVHRDHLRFLKETEDDAFDVVYFDPMFTTGVKTSEGINAIRTLALQSELTDELIHEAKRVARERVVLKDHWKSDRFKNLGFVQHRRKTSLFHYGTIE
ncbi:class I SAM-dependent methyltransferase [Radiobacillus deserti]|uniref:SAM-dependent methyltransferase n=1 Tax=Radiobacillus deserti TaxID=2594883 RepID=A0A516KH85_9BACI|nr:class I SAM-dependent methyltransferase [Radiobacillus deserti]QDP40760.1 hypothetical protein FN924_11530 [Radiobacillus deserti]